MQNAGWGSIENAGRGQPGYIMQTDFNRGDPLPGFGIKVLILGRRLSWRRDEVQASYITVNMLSKSMIQCGALAYRKATDGYKGK